MVHTDTNAQTSTRHFANHIVLLIDSVITAIGKDCAGSHDGYLSNTMAAETSAVLADSESFSHIFPWTPRDSSYLPNGRLDDGCLVKADPGALVIIFVD